MNYMFDFSPRELQLLAMAIMFLGAQVENDDNAPDELSPTLESIHNKLVDVMKLRMENEQKFDELVAQSLSDLQSVSQQIIDNPNYETENN